MQERNETAQLQEIRARLVRDFPAAYSATVDAALTHTVDELADARIRNFVPVPVERSAKGV